MNENLTVIKTDRRKEQQRQAAKSVGIPAATAWRISKTPEFEEEHRRVGRDAFEQSVACLQQASSALFSRLRCGIKKPVTLNRERGECRRAGTGQGLPCALPSEAHTSGFLCRQTKEPTQW